MQHSADHEDEDRKPLLPQDNKRNISALHIGVVAFFAVASGPIGIEDAIGAAGPMFTLITLAVVSIFWALPQAFMSVELSTMFTENGGYIIWVQSALGNFAGFVNAYCNIYSNMFDISLYPVSLYNSVSCLFLYTLRYYSFNTYNKYMISQMESDWPSSLPLLYSSTF
jgi:amino acid transporter